MNSDHIPAHLFDWLEQYPFEALSSEQQAEVRIIMTAETYAQYRDIVSDFQQLPGPSSQTNAISSPAQIVPLPWYNRLKIPWPIAASALLLVGIFSFQFGKFRRIPDVDADTIPIFRASQSLADKMYSDSLVFEL